MAWRAIDCIQRGRKVVDVTCGCFSEGCVLGGGGKTDNDGTSGLRSELRADVQTVARVAMEMSDACAVLGSGARGAVEDMDAAESKVTADFEFMMSSKPRH